MNADALCDTGLSAGDRCEPVLAPEDMARVGLYGLLARLFLDAPDADLLAVLAREEADIHGAGRFSMARKRLACCAATSTPIAVSDEFDRMFVSIGAPRIIPNASHYLAGFLHEAPLVNLRSDLAALGLARSSGQLETEDHLALLCDTMRVLISGGRSASLSSVPTADVFFAKHLASWAQRCLADMRGESKDGFYLHVADLAEEFFEIETESLRYDDTLVAA